MTHALAALEARASGQILCQCACGAISGQRDESAHWLVVPNGDGTASASPSIDWPGHFHETFARAPLGKVDWDRYLDSPAWDIDHPGQR